MKQINPAVELAAMALSTIKDMYNISAQQETNREQIRAYRDIEIERIRAQKEVIKEYLLASFSERNEVLMKMFETLDHGLKNNNSDIIAFSLKSIVDVANTSPLADFIKFKAELYDDSVKRIEI